MANTYFTVQFDYVEEYNQQLWGDLIYGTERQLKAIGLGINKTYPVTERKGLRIVDPRGFKTIIRLSSYRGDGIYSASISFPNRTHPDNENKYEEFAKGIRLDRNWWFDEYFGCDSDLVNAGILKAEHIPSKNGIAKVQVTIAGDGLPAKGKAGAFYSGGKEGAKQITRVSNNKLRVRVRVSEELEQIRRKAGNEMTMAWENEMNALPRPKPLTLNDGIKLHIEMANKNDGYQAFKNLVLLPVNLD